MLIPRKDVEIPLSEWHCWQLFWSPLLSMLFHALLFSSPLFPLFHLSFSFTLSSCPSLFGRFFAGRVYVKKVCLFAISVLMSVHFLAENLIWDNNNLIWKKRYYNSLSPIFQFANEAWKKHGIIGEGHWFTDHIDNCEI